MGGKAFMTSRLMDMPTSTDSKPSVLVEDVVDGADVSRVEAVSGPARDGAPAAPTHAFTHDVSKDKFEQMIASGEFAEWAEVHGVELSRSAMVRGSIVSGGCSMSVAALVRCSAS